MTFREAKTIIRAALREASDQKLVEVLEAARAGEMRYQCSRQCLDCRLNGRWVGCSDLSMAYQRILGPDYNDIGYSWSSEGEGRRQRTIVPLILAEISHRSRSITAKENTHADVQTIR